MSKMSTEKEGASPFDRVEEELLTEGVYASNTVGSSMRPLLRHHRDMVIITPPEGEIKKYDVVLYRRAGDVYTLHRVICVKDDHFVIRGDNTYIREFVPKDKIIGVMQSYNRGGKHHSVTEFGYKFYSRFWNFIYPLRFVMYKLLRPIWHFLNAMYRKVKAK